jgi:hypothetical protein
MFKFKLLMFFNIHDMCKPQSVFKYNLKFLVNCVFWMNNELQQLVIFINHLINVVSSSLNSSVGHLDLLTTHVMNCLGIYRYTFPGYTNSNLCKLSDDNINRIIQYPHSHVPEFLGDRLPINSTVLAQQLV